MPRLIDAIGKMSVNRQVIFPSRIKETAKSLPQKFPLDKLTLKNKLKTKVTVGSEDSVKKFSDFIERNDTVFAPWANHLNRQPNTDCFKQAPINTVKQPKEVNEHKAIREAYKLSDWLRRTDAIIAHTFKR